MAIEFFTGFEGCGSSSDIHSMLSWQGNNLYPSLSLTGGYDGSKSVRTSSSASGNFGINCKTPGLTKAVGGHFSGLGKYSPGTYSSCLFGFMMSGETSANTVFIWNTAGGVVVTKGATVIATFGTTPISEGQHHVQVKVFSHATQGTVDVLVDGVSIGSATGLDTNGQLIDVIQFGTTNTGTLYMDNLYISDQLEGELISILCKPSSDSAVQFTPFTGTDNYAMVDDIDQDGDSTYVESNMVGHTDRYGFEDIPSGYTIKAATLVTVAKKDDVGARTLQPIARQDATDYDIGDEAVLSTDYPAEANTGSITTLATAPDATEWTNTKFNACEWGFKVAL